MLLCPICTLSTIPPFPYIPHPPADVRFEVTARRSDGSASRRGIYLRDPQDAKQPLTFQ